MRARGSHLLTAFGALAIALGVPGTARGDDMATVDAGSLRATITANPWHVELTDAAGGRVLSESTRQGADPAGTLGVKTLTGWAHAVRAESLRREGTAVRATLRLDDGRAMTVRIAPAGDGVIAMKASGPEGSAETAMGFEAPAGERYLGFGERSDEVVRSRGEVESYVSDGPFREEDRQYPKLVSPPWANRDRDDATYYPVPWLLSTRGYGVLVDRDETSRFRLRDDAQGTWSASVDGSRLDLRFFGGPTPAAALARFTAATGRQPPPPAPWAFGPWFQTGQPNIVPLEDEARIVKTLRDADAPVSAAETQLHYLPCGAQRGNEAYVRARDDAFHAAGLAHLAYLNPALCVSYTEAFDGATKAGVLQRGPADAPFLFPAFVGGGGPAGFTSEPLALFDFTAPGAQSFYGSLVRGLVDAGHDGWMEDFGEASPPVVRPVDGTDPAALHNRYPTDYHCTVRRIARGLTKPVVRFQRSGWTGAAACADDVWGGDPTTVFGYDGLASAVRQALSIGTSGISRWGSDIGGYDSFGPAEQLTPELLQRWIAFGAVSGVMRTKRSGLAFPSYERPQVFDPAILPVWRRFTKLHTQLYPYLLAADARYRRTGMPLMSQLGLSYPGDEKALGIDDELLFGPDLLAAPVVDAGARERRLYLPRGDWVDVWRSVRFDEPTGALLPTAPRLVSGGADVTLPAPLDEIPLLARAGAVLPMLPADVDTLAPYGEKPGLVHLSDRADRMTLLAFPRGRSTADFNEDEAIASIEGRRRWVLAIAGVRTRTYTIRAELGTLTHPFAPRRVTVGRRTLPRSDWSYDRATGALTVTATLRRGAVRVEGRRAYARRHRTRPTP